MSWFILVFLYVSTIYLIYLSNYISIYNYIVYEYNIATFFFNSSRTRKNIFTLVTFLKLKLRLAKTPKSFIKLIKIVGQLT
jgi:hypothetical protein